MTVENKAEIKKLIKEGINKAVQEMKYDVLDMIRTEISAATGSKYGYYECVCGKKQTPYYRDPRNIRVPFCHVCGKSMTWKLAT